MSRIYDIILIGGGVVGLGVFNRLTLNGYRNVLLVERSSQILTGASAGNSGILHTGFDTTPGTLESKLVQRGYELYHALAEDIQLPIKKIGAHLAAWNLEELPVLQQIIHTAHLVCKTLLIAIIELGLSRLEWSERYRRDLCRDTVRPRTKSTPASPVGSLYSRRMHRGPADITADCLHAEQAARWTRTAEYRSDQGRV